MFRDILLLIRSGFALPKQVGLHLGRGTCTRLFGRPVPLRKVLSDRIRSGREECGRPAAFQVFCVPADGWCRLNRSPAFRPSRLPARSTWMRTGLSRRAHIRRCCGFVCCSDWVALEIRMCVLRTWMPAAFTVAACHLSRLGFLQRLGCCCWLHRMLPICRYPNSTSDQWRFS